jgi:cytidyltransferase-like protein
MKKKKKIFVTGCFDMLHSGHVAFLEEAATYGDVYVGIGSDETVRNLKGRYPINNQDERKYMIEALKCVKKCLINSGSGIMDFIGEMKRVSPDVFIVNEDGNTPAKAKLSKELGIKYLVLKRIPHEDLPARSTTALRRECTIPYRIDLAGGWLDQPFVSKFYPGPVLTISIEPTVEFNERSGMASSSRRKAIELWQSDVPAGNKEQLAKVLFSFENPPGKNEVSGSQDALGIVLPGLNRLDYDGSYWPFKITSVQDESILRWIEDHLHLITLGPREPQFSVLDDTDITRRKARALSDAAIGCWDAIRSRNLRGFGDNFRKSFEAQVAMFPNMLDGDIDAVIEKYRKHAAGWKLSGAGGGGYLILVTDREIKGAMKIKIRRKSL